MYPYILLNSFHLFLYYPILIYTLRSTLSLMLKTTSVLTYITTITFHLHYPTLRSSLLSHLFHNNFLMLLYTCLLEHFFPSLPSLALACITLFFLTFLFLFNFINLILYTSIFNKLHYLSSTSFLVLFFLVLPALS